MEKYLGNKRSILDSLYWHITELCPNSNSISDLFAGTTNVGRYFRNKGFKIISNDINRFSYVLGHTYLNLTYYPTFEKLKLPTPNSSLRGKLKDSFLKSVQRDRGQLFPTQQAETVWQKLLPSVSVISHLNGLSYKKDNNIDFIVDYFTTGGRKSSFKSVRGSIGKRNYFSSGNAQKLSAVLSVVRKWWQDSKISNDEVYFLLTSILEEIVIVANVNGTFHDFNRDRLWPNALQEFFMKIPLTYVNKIPASIYCQDAKLLAHQLPTHDILYIDPPYNFRQYAAYYHFLNFIAAYPFLPSLEDYMGKLMYVRGQNSQDDFTSDFCFRDRFVDALRHVITNTSAQYVVLSYFNGRNHWNHWSKGTGKKDQGFSILDELFSNRVLFSEYFSLSTMQKRTNYQSREGEKKSQVSEYIFWGKKASKNLSTNKKRDVQNMLLENNKLLCLQEFCPTK